MKVSFRILILLSAVFTSSGAALAGSLPSPSGPVILTVTGGIENTNAAGAARFDLEMLRAVDDSEIVTDTIWTPGDHRFTGVRLDRLMEYVGASGRQVKAMAINDYSVIIPLSDAGPDGPIIAHSMDGRQMSRRQKGPLWIVYPYASSPKFQTEVIYSRSIWQLDRMNFEE